VDVEDVSALVLGREAARRERFSGETGRGRRGGRGTHIVPGLDLE
jgi:hypothetical protein